MSTGRVFLKNVGDLVRYGDLYARRFIELRNFNQYIPGQCIEILTAINFYSILLYQLIGREGESIKTHVDKGVAGPGDKRA